MTHPASFLERYEQGDHTAVWNDLHALGDQIRQPPLSADALAVAQATMQRLRPNPERLIPRPQRPEDMFAAGPYAAPTPPAAGGVGARRPTPRFPPPPPPPQAPLAALQSPPAPLP